MQRFLCTALYAYKATHPDQMDMDPGERFTVLEEKLPGGWTQVHKNDQNQGKVPTSYLKIGKTTSIIILQGRNLPQSEI